MTTTIGIFTTFPNDGDDVTLPLSQSNSVAAMAMATPPMTTLAPTPVPKERHRPRRLSRKSGNPQRSCSWTDASPGIFFKMLPTPQILAAFPQCIIRTMGAGGTKPIVDAAKAKRCRSLSVTSLSSTQQQLNFVRNRRFSADIISVTESGDEDDENASDGDINTNCLNAQVSRGLKKVSNLTNSLAHLVPNSMLMNISRRVSAHGSADGCRCSSCSITVTPYWRDGWANDVMLCNACGLRFQKFAQRCFKCHYIPRKEDNVVHTCPQCNAIWEC